ncbi:hypothetical protein [Albibacillus kandeliae]|uniref:hypothetical protein n=1 Tax=Albibacillus kandeliae TaxID=2174228 RepID=UPI000D69152A|nr:hypothetical protein [Albibacillus kandeliae]
MTSELAEPSDLPQNPEKPHSGPEQTRDEELWFIPGPVENEPDYLPPGPKSDPSETAVVEDWRQAEAGQAALLARVAARLGALDDRLGRGPEGWRHRLALIEAAELSWVAGDRIGPDRLALWIALRLAGAQEDVEALSRVGWAVRRLTGGPGPESSLGDFLGRQDPATDTPGEDLFSDRAASWLYLMNAGRTLHPISRACMGFHLWNIAGLGQHGDTLEAAVTAVRIAASDGAGALFAPLAMGGAWALRADGTPSERLSRWLSGMESATLRAMRHLDDIEAWSIRAEATMTVLSGRTPPALRKVLADWPLVSAPMAEALTGASRAAVQRNLGWMENRGLLYEVTGQGRFKMWRAQL